MKVNEYFEKWGINDNGGIISNAAVPYFVVRTDYPIPYNADMFPTSATFYTELDEMFHSRYGERFLSTYVTNRPIRNGKTSAAPTSEEEAAARRIAYSINRRFADKWNTLFITWKLDYNPIENYNRTETEEYTKTNTGTVGDVTSSTTSTETSTDSSSETESIMSGTKNTSVDAKSKNNVFGFDSSSEEFSPEGTSIGGADLDSAISHSNTAESFNNYKDTTNASSEGSANTSATTSGTGTRTDNLSEGLDREVHISGNIGVTTTQQMMMQEWELRKNLFYDMVIDDIASVLTLSIYDFK